MTESNPPSHIAIVGCGFSGTTALYQLVHSYPVRRISVFETSGEFGPGFPYQTDESRSYLINNTNDTMCLDPADRRAFVSWLHGHPEYGIDLDEKSHMPRAVYGEFLKDAVAGARDRAAAEGIELEFVAEEVTDIEEQADGQVMVVTNERQLVADIAILTTGRCPELDAFDMPANEKYFRTHMPGHKLDELPTDAECYVIGASLSAYDVVNQLFSPSSGCRFVADGPNRLHFEAGENRRKLVLCSRSGRLKKIQSRHPFSVQIGHLESVLAAGQVGDVTLESLFALMLEDAAASGAHIDNALLADPYQNCATRNALQQRAAALLESDIDAAASPADSTANFIVDYLERTQFLLWDIFASHVLTHEDEARFRTDFQSAFLSYAAPCPSSTAQKVLALMRCERLEIIRGVRSVTSVPESGSARIEHADGSDIAEFVINASGSVQRDVRDASQPELVKNLVRKGLLSPYQRGTTELNGAAVDMQTFRAAGSRSIYIANMFLWGPGLYVSAAITMATIVKRILSTVYDR